MFPLTERSDSERPPRKSGDSEEQPAVGDGKDRHTAVCLGQVSVFFKSLKFTAVRHAIQYITHVFCRTQPGSEPWDQLYLLPYRCPMLVAAEVGHGGSHLQPQPSGGLRLPTLNASQVSEGTVLHTLQAGSQTYILYKRSKCS